MSLRDDGAIVYPNSVEVFRSNMPTGAVNYRTLAVANALPGDETTNYYPTNLGPALLRAGNNVLAVAVHQSTNTSRDISFDFALEATWGERLPPVVAFAGRAGVLTVQWPADAGFFSLWTTTNLAPPMLWTPATNLPVLQDGLWQVPLGLTSSPVRFFRLQAP